MSQQYSSQVRDVIGDLEVGSDKIDVSALGFHNLGDLTITPGSQTVVRFSTVNFVTLIGVTIITVIDFIFA